MSFIYISLYFKVFVSILSTNQTLTQHEGKRERAFSLPQILTHSYNNNNNPKRDAEKAGQAIDKVIGTVVEKRNSVSISEPPKNAKSKLKTRPLKLPSAVCQEMMLRSDLDLSKFPSHSSVLNTNLAIKSISAFFPQRASVAQDIEIQCAIQEQCPRNLDHAKKALLDASKLIQPKWRPTSAVAAKQSHVSKHFQNEAALTTSGPVFPHASAGGMKGFFFTSKSFLKEIGIECCSCVSQATK
ncbi:hypothetical protein BJ741DRAFT_666275 [Chytriomyces cf. hyalinus JEL632]|nr:hypothetical protein BJ741DRAFT_666275 [Chytriomyces cf. hyalinus JEL632]